MATWLLATLGSLAVLHSAAAIAQPNGALAAAVGEPAAPPTRLQAHAFNLSAVRLTPGAGNHFAAAQALNTQFLLYLDPDRLLFSWRMIAQLQPFSLNGAVPYGGWITPYSARMELVNGHFTGHYLSATAFTAAATDDPLIRQKSAYLVAGIAKCQDAICAANASQCGYVSAFHLAQVERVENHTGPTWATYYTLHKIMAGLLDTYEQTENAQAWTVLLKMATYFKKRIDNVIKEKGMAWWETCLLVEFGGMNEVAYNIYAITGDPEHKQLGDYFYKAVFMDPIARSDEYALTGQCTGQHANTHLPEIIGVARGWETTGNSTLQVITTEFMRILTAHYTYAATGGSNQGEHWLYPDQLGAAVATKPGADSPGYHTEESCTQYNVLKIVRHLFRWAPTAALGDDYEHKVNNGVIGIQKPSAIGTMVYMTPLGNGVSKPQANFAQGWGSKNNSFWCCYGTAIESFGKLGDSIYFHDGAANATSAGKPNPAYKPQLWVVQFVSSTLKDVMHGVNLTQSVSNVRSSLGRKNNALQTTITVGALGGAGAAGARGIAKDLTISLRIPGWADASATTVSLNGVFLIKLGTAQVGTFLHVKRPQWKSGDVLKASFGMRPRFVKLNDNRDTFDNVGSLHYGPYLLVGMSNGSYALQADAADIDSWLTLDAASSPAAAYELSFRAKSTSAAGGGFALLPLNRVVDELYTAHFNVSKDASQCQCGNCDAASSTAAGIKSLKLDSNTGHGGSKLVAAGTATVSGSIIRSGNPGDHTAVVMAAPFVGKGTIIAISFSYKYTVGYINAKGAGATVSLTFHESVHCPDDVLKPPLNSTAILHTSPAYLTPMFDGCHCYNSSGTIALKNLDLQVGKPGARLALHFADGGHNLQLQLPIEVELTWKQSGEHHH